MQALQARGLAPGRRRQRGQPAEPDPAVGHGQVRRHRIHGANERLARGDRRPQRPAGAARANGTTTYLRDVAYVRDGFSPQTNIVRQDGARGVLLSVLKNGGASTLDIVANLKALLPRVERRSCPATSR